MKATGQQECNVKTRKSMHFNQYNSCVSRINLREGCITRWLRRVLVLAEREWYFHHVVHIRVVLVLVKGNILEMTSILYTVILQEVIFVGVKNFCTLLFKLCIRFGAY